MSQRDSSDGSSVPTTWEEYAKRAADAMGKLARGEISLDCCYDLLPLKPPFVSEEVHRFIRDLISEVDYDRSGFRELHEHLTGGATESQIIDLMRWLG